MALRNIAIAGATGHIGKPLMTALLDSDQFNLTVLARAGSSTTTPHPEKVTAATVDYSQPATVTEALKGQDAVICALGSNLVAEQQTLLEAAVEAKVKRFIPSEFGSDTQNPNAAKLPLFAGKKKMESLIEELASQDKITYTYIYNGPFLDFGLAAGFLGIDLRKKKASLLDGGERKFSTTTRATAARAVAEVLRRPEETKNRAVYIQDTAVTVNYLLQLSKIVVGEAGWTVEDVGSSADLEKNSYEKLNTGQKDMGVFVGFLQAAIFRDGYGGLFQNFENEKLGFTQMKESDLLNVIREASQA